jgi:hypothetical protein
MFPTRNDRDTNPSDGRVICLPGEISLPWTLKSFIQSASRSFYACTVVLGVVRNEIFCFDLWAVCKPSCGLHI